MTKIIVVTPTFNSEKTIDRTIKSVIFQNGNFEIYFHLQDGGSTDATIEKISHWKYLIDSKKVPIECKRVNFSFSQENDDGMYDAIVKGFNKFKTQDGDWMCWINSDDILMPMAFSLLNAISKEENTRYIKWVTGAPSTAYFDGRPLTSSFRYFNKNIISRGLCDGVHYDFVQQEGSFFKAELWKKINIKNDFLKFKLAGDWNLWRKFSEHSEIFTIRQPLGVFHRTENQKSSAQRAAYKKEIEEIISPEIARKSLFELREEDMISHIINIKYADGGVYLEKFNFVNSIEAYRNKFRPKKSPPKVYKKEFKFENNILFFDEDWQFPAITEKHAFEKMREFMPKLDKKIIYLAFPWATLIDLQRNKPENALGLIEKLASAKKILNELKPRKVVTVCQHIFMSECMHIFEDLGVSDVFWTHAVKNEMGLTKNTPVEIHSFPLFPVQSPNKLTTKNSRKYLYSFVGARSDSWYLKQTRNWILDNLRNDPRGYIAGRNEWHFNKIVYDHQISGVKNENLINKNDEEEFSLILSDSLFSLCPSGSGPNTIRLWESIGFGSIPVVLSDTHKLPGNFALWEKAVVFIEETEENIRSIPDILESIARDKEKISSMQTAMKVLWGKYGPDFFVYDVLKYLQVKSDELALDQDKYVQSEFVVKFDSEIESISRKQFNYDSFYFRMFLRELSIFTITKRDDLCRIMHQDEKFALAIKNIKERGDSELISLNKVLARVQ